MQARTSRGAQLQGHNKSTYLVRQRSYSPATEQRYGGLGKITGTEIPPEGQQPRARLQWTNNNGGRDRRQVQLGPRWAASMVFDHERRPPGLSFRMTAAKDMITGSRRSKGVKEYRGRLVRISISNPLLRPGLQQCADRLELEQLRFPPPYWRVLRQNWQLDHDGVVHVVVREGTVPDSERPPPPTLYTVGESCVLVMDLNQVTFDFLCTLRSAHGFSGIGDIEVRLRRSRNVLSSACVGVPMNP